MNLQGEYCFYIFLPMDYTKESLNKLHIVELKNVAKSLKLQYGGSKTQLIKRIIDANTPDNTKPVVHSHPAHLSPPDKKIIGVIVEDTPKMIQIGKLKEHNKARDLYYSLGVLYYEVDKDFNFL